MSQPRYRSLPKGIPARAEPARRPRHAAHPGPGTYVAIGAILGVLTLTEFLILFWEPVQRYLGLSVVVFGVLSAVKFALVAMFFMHLRFDSRLFSWLFVGGILLAAAIIITLIALFAAG